MERTLIALAALAVFLAAADASAVTYRFSNIADTNTAAPNGGNFTGFANPAISGNVVAFRGTYGPPLQDGIFTGNGGPLTTIAKFGDPGPVSILGGFTQHSISGETVAFYAAYNSLDQGIGIFVGSGGPLTTIVKKGDPPFGTFPSFYDPGIDGDTIVFESLSSNGTSGVITSSQGQFTVIAALGDPAPSGTFHSLGSPAISGDTIAFRGHFHDEGDPEVDRGIFTKNSGVIKTIAERGDAAPSGVLQDFFNLSLSGDNVAFVASYDGNQEGIFAGNGGPLTTIVKGGDAAPAGDFHTLIQPAISGNAVAFLGFYNESFEHGIFIGDGGPLTTVIKTGDALFGSTVSQLWDFQFDRAFAMDPYNSGRIAFRYELSDGRAGVALARLAPEPNTVVLLSIMGAAVCVRRYKALKLSRA